MNGSLHFAVSIDELLGYRLSQREEAHANTKKEAERLAEVGTLEERLAFARNALVRYPYDPELRQNLAVCLYIHDRGAMPGACRTTSVQTIPPAEP